MESTNKNNQKQYVALQEPLTNNETPQEQENPKNSFSISIPNPDIANQKVADLSSAFLIYIKYLDNSQKELDINTIMDQKILELQKLAFPQSFNDETKSIRLIYQGKLLNTEDVINSCNFQKGGFIHAVINDKIVDEADNNNLNALQSNNGNTQISQVPMTSSQSETLQIMNLIIEAQNSRRNDAENNAEQNNSGLTRLSLRTFDNEQNWMFIMGAVFGYFLSIWGVIIMFLCNFPDRARSGVTFGFCLHIMVKILNGL
jgi:hypothetical protein